MEIIDSGDRNADEQRKGAGKDMELKMRTDVWMKWELEYGMEKGLGETRGSV